VNDAPPSHRRQNLAVCVVAVLVVAFFVWLFVRPQGDKPADAKIPDAANLVRAKNTAVGMLENLPNDEANDGAECVAAFEQLSQALPEEPLGPRNLAIARLLILDQQISAGQGAPALAAYEQANAALQFAATCEGDIVTVRLLKAHLARLGVAANAIDNPRAISDAYLAATEKAPIDPLVWSEFYVATRDSADEAEQNAGREALRRAFALRPQNIALLVEWLLVQAETHDPTIAETLVVARDELAPLAPTIKERGVDLAATINAASDELSAPDEERWNRVLRQIRPLVFVVRPDPVYQFDRAHLERHVLEYALQDFTRAFYESAQLPKAQTPPAIPVKFVGSEGPLRLPAGSAALDVVVADCDLDNRLDVIVVENERIIVLAQLADGNGWKPPFEVATGGGIRKVVAQDLDRDEDLDLVGFGSGGARLFENQLTDGQIKLIPVEQQPLQELSDVHAVAVVDLEHDGDLDLVLSDRASVTLWSNRGEFRFTNLSAQSFLPPPDLPITAIVPVDWSRDAAIDLVLAGATTGPGIMENLFHTRFRWRPFDIALTEGVQSLSLADVDGNASWDLLMGGQEGLMLQRSQQLPNGEVRLLPPQPVSPAAVKGVRSWDFDNDGHGDIVAWSDGGIQILRGNPDGTFAAAQLLADEPQAVAACDVGDLDGDGDIDLVVATADGPRWYVNEGGNANQWIDISLKAESDPKFPAQRTNSHAIGSLLELKAGPRYQAQVVTGQTTHFGLGTLQRADVVRALFTNGVPQNVLEPAVGTHILAEQRILKGSCPYVYTWTGEKYEFFTDLLWNAPIGLQFAEGVLAPAREWEYLLVPGDRLVEAEGEYTLQITEELWEATYFDQVELIAVDHPAEVQVYSNEKVGPAEIAEFKIHTVRSSQAPVAARDQHGRDVLPLIAARDDRYLRAYDHRFAQGVTEEQTIDLDLGQWESPKSFTLFLTGWVLPSDTSLNVSISQDPSRPAPKPPSLWVPDADGEWKQVLPFCGFPGGKTKTIAIPLPADVFVNGEYRVRLATTMQLNWDQMFFTVDEPTAEYRLTKMAPLSADLHHRGYSRRTEHPANGPESYDYYEVSTAPRWPPMWGRFTRYGDVAPLLQETDDLLVVIGAGDEVTVRFSVPDEPTPAGWRRDFLLYNVGWDKDADLNTVLGQTVEPLPFLAMPRYPYPPDVTWPDTPDHRRYLETYQTREQRPGHFWKWVRDNAGN